MSIGDSAAPALRLGQARCGFQPPVPLMPTTPSTVPTSSLATCDRPGGGEEVTVGILVLMHLGAEQRLDHAGGAVRRHRRATGRGARDQRSVRTQPRDHAPVLLRRRREAVGEVVRRQRLVTDGARGDEALERRRLAQRQPDDEVDLRVARHRPEVDARARCASAPAALDRWERWPSNRLLMEGRNTTELRRFISSVFITCYTRGGCRLPDPSSSSTTSARCASSSRIACAAPATPSTVAESPAAAARRARRARLRRGHHRSARCRAAPASTSSTAVKRRPPDTQVIVVTAFATAETAIAAMKRGAYDYLTKPFKVDEIGVGDRARAREARAARARTSSCATSSQAASASTGSLGKSPRDAAACSS